MDIRKEPGGVARHSPDREDMVLINRLAREELTAEQVYTFSLRLCDNEIDRDWERFDQKALEGLRELFAGKSGIFDHHWSAQGQTARLYKTELCREEGRTAAGDACLYLKGWAYMLRSEKNRELISEIEAGIKKEVSVGCSVARRVCSVCGEERCGHQGGREYDGKLCFFTLQDPTDAYEWSFVAVPAQRKAGVIKSFRQEPGALKRLAAGRPECLEELAELEREAEMGRSYMRALRGELKRLAGLAEESLNLQLFAKSVDRMEEDELLELTRVFRQRLDGKHPLATQLHARPSAARAEEDGAFLI